MLLMLLFLPLEEEAFPDLKVLLHLISFSPSKTLLTFFLAILAFSFFEKAVDDVDVGSAEQ
jgi:hypothetical protein